MWVLYTIAACTEQEPRDDEVAPPVDETVGVDDPTQSTDGTAEEEPATTTITLSLPAEPEGLLRLDLEREDVEALLGPIAADIELLSMDPDVLLYAALGMIRSACGTDWARDRANPSFDCDATALGRSFGADWAASPELAMVRLLTTTPANVDVRNTSLEGVAGAANGLNIGGGFADILADTLERDTTDLAVGDDALVAAIREGLLATHPATTATGELVITLEDALTDLATLGSTLGPSGAHPGVLDPTEVPFGRVLGEDFGMELAVESHLSVLDGIDLTGGVGGDSMGGNGAGGPGKGYLVRVGGTGGAGGDAPVSLSFDDPERFQIRGLVDQPVVDLRLSMVEAPTRAEACTGSDACWPNAPGNPVNPESVWGFDPWTLEALVADASRREHEGRSYRRTYWLILPAVTITMGDDAPGAWTHFDVLLDIGDPPPDQYVWELLLEVAQQNLHEWDTYAFEEGEANPSFSLTGLPTGLSAAATEAAVRSSLQQQEAEIADALFGNHAERSDPVDLVLVRGDSGEPALQWVAASERPGFFADQGLTDPVGTTISGHPSWVVPEGPSTVYVQAEGGRRFRLGVEAHGASPTEVRVTISEVAP